ncbi:MAG: response regulator [Deltaproteobacteria bacterium]|nr:response regulator [Deltaproteobacteria bacterium]
MQDHDVLSGKKLLIVDDESDVLETIEEMLGMCLIDKAHDFSTGKHFLDTGAYDAAIFDIMGVRGYELLRLAAERGIPVLMLTAHALSPDNLIKSIREGAQSYVPKDELLDLPAFLREMLEARRQDAPEQARWFSRLRPFFDRQFGPGWREKDQEFWSDFDSKRVTFKKDRGNMP